MPVIQANAYGMAYGSAFMFIFSVLLGKEFLFEMTVPYVSSLIYLSVFGSIAAFGMYLTLIGRIGADRTAYTALLFPLVALGLSAVFEGYRWDSTALTGVILILLGNVLVLTRVNGALQRVKAVRA
jgi:drug/metabolite transporter (DMT)-like permease